MERVLSAFRQNTTRPSRFIGTAQLGNIRRVTQRMTALPRHVQVIYELDTNTGKGKRYLTPEPIVPNLLSGEIRTAPRASRLRFVAPVIKDERPFFAYFVEGEPTGIIGMVLPPGIYEELDQRYIEGVLVHELQHAEDDAFGKLDAPVDPRDFTGYLTSRQESRAFTSEIIFWVQEYGHVAASDIISRFDVSRLQKYAMLLYLSEIAGHVGRAAIPLGPKREHRMGGPGEVLSRAMLGWVRANMGGRYLRGS